jgi:HSP20 family molecular chaperone IbpA
MRNGAAPNKLKTRGTAIPRTIVAGDVTALLEKIQQEIARRAYTHYERRGCERGRDLEDWLAAETEVVSPQKEEMAQSDQTISLRVKMGGFTAEEIEVGVTPDRVIIWAQHGSGSMENKPSTHARPAYEASVVLKVIPLPGTIDPSNAVTDFSHEELILELPIADHFGRKPDGQSRKI